MKKIIYGVFATLCAMSYASDVFALWGFGAAQKRIEYDRPFKGEGPRPKGMKSNDEMRLTEMSIEEPTTEMSYDNEQTVPPTEEPSEYSIIQELNGLGLSVSHPKRYTFSMNGTLRGTKINGNDVGTFFMLFVNPLIKGYEFSSTRPLTLDFTRCVDTTGLLAIVHEIQLYPQRSVKLYLSDISDENFLHIITPCIGNLHTLGVENCPGLTDDKRIMLNKLGVNVIVFNGQEKTVHKAIRTEAQ